MPRLHRDEGGQSLVIVLSLITIMFLLGSSLAVHGSVALRSTRASESQSDEFYAADAATELGIWWQRNGKAGNPPAQTINGVTTSTTISTAGGGGSCPPDVAAKWMNGFESGVVSRTNGATNTNLGGGFTWVNGTGPSPGTGFVDIVSSPVRTGNHALRIAPSSAAGNFGYLEAPWGVALQPTQVVHLAVRFSALPTAESNVLTLGHGGSIGWAKHQLFITYRPSSGKWAIGLGSNTMAVSQESNVTVALNTWYAIDVRFDFGTNVKTGDWYIDGVAQPSVTFTDNPSGSGSTARIAFGQYVLSTAQGYGSAWTGYIDDVLVSLNSADFPLGPLKIAPLLPNAMGTHNTPGNYQNNDNSAINGSSWQRLDDMPMTGTTDYLKQVTNGGASYVEIAFQDTAETCIRGANLVAAIRAAATAADNAAVGHVMNSTNVSAWSGDASETFLRYFQRVVSTNTLTQGIGPWTQAGVNGTVARFGYSTDASPNPYLDAILLEVAYKTLTAGPATVTIVGTGGGSTITTDYLDAGAGIPTLNTWTTTK